MRDVVSALIPSFDSVLQTGLVRINYWNKFLVLKIYIKEDQQITTIQFPSNINVQQ